MESMVKTGSWLEDQMRSSGSLELDGGLEGKDISWEFAVFMFGIHFHFFR